MDALLAGLDQMISGVFAAVKVIAVLQAGEELSFAVVMSALTSPWVVVVGDSLAWAVFVFCETWSSRVSWRALLEMGKACVLCSAGRQSAPRRCRVFPGTTRRRSPDRQGRRRTMVKKPRNVGATTKAGMRLPKICFRSEPNRKGFACEVRFVRPGRKRRGRKLCAGRVPGALTVRRRT